MFDKTGTLTMGRPTVVGPPPVNFKDPFEITVEFKNFLLKSHFQVGRQLCDGQPPTQLLRMVAAAEAGSHHPLARAVLSYAHTALAEELGVGALPPHASGPMQTSSALSPLVKGDGHDPYMTPNTAWRRVPE